jgi:WXG100 family type VII secretion target
MTDVFTIDTDDLESVISDVEAVENRLETLTSDLEGQMRRLHATWEGLAAQAHDEAHAEWTEGMRTMRQALADLRAAARGAHGNYTAAANANVSMWQDLA